MKRIVTFTIILSVVITISNCVKFRREPISLQNNYYDTIYPLVAVPGRDHVYPDTTLPISRPAMKSVPPGENWVIIETGMGGDWASIISYLPSDTLSVYLFSADALRIYSWPQVRDEYKVLKRYDLSLQDLKSSNYTITYP